VLTLENLLVEINSARICAGTLHETLAAGKTSICVYCLRQKSAS
jgi:hypothetical protein